MNSVFYYTKIKLKDDRYGGVIIDDSTIPQTLEVLEENLKTIISEQKDKKLLWITLPIGKSDYIPLLTKHNFVFLRLQRDQYNSFKATCC